MTNKVNKYLDGETLFREYYLGGKNTIVTLTEWAILEGMISSKGNKPTQMGIWKSMWRWASLKENKETAWQIIQSSLNGKAPKREHWEYDMIHVKIPSAWQHSTQRKLNKFLKKNGWING